MEAQPLDFLLYDVGTGLAYGGGAALGLPSLCRTDLAYGEGAALGLPSLCRTGLAYGGGAALGPY